MIHRWELRWRRLRRWFSPADWLAWRLGSPGDSAAGDEPGLVLVQIKGLSRAELEWHLGEGRIPFLQQLLAREKYRLRRLEPERHATIPGPAAEPFHDLGGTIRQGQDFWKGGTLSAQVDAARGLPMVRLTFAGYDQQSRRHGLESYRARAALRRIDRSIRRVWNAAQRSLAREYDVWICSESGSQSVTAIEKGRARCETAKSETGGFALVPGDVPVPDAETLQPADLRSAALHWLGRHPEPWPRLPVPVNRDGESIRVLTYNVHSCLGMDGKRSPRRIARVIAQCKPDIVALQELDVRRVRSGGRDQAHEISQELRMVFHFHPALRVEDERYGDALLSRHPLRLIHAGPLPGPPSGGAVEPRGALWGEVAIGGRPLQILTTHLGLSAAERQRQIETLLGDEWLPFGSTPRRPDWRFLQICTTESGIRGRSS